MASERTPDEVAEDLEDTAETSALGEPLVFGHRVMLRVAAKMLRDLHAKISEQAKDLKSAKINNASLNARLEMALAHQPNYGPRPGRPTPERNQKGAKS